MVLGKEEKAARLGFVRLWASYVKTHPNAEWSRQQAVLVNSALRGADQDRERYLAVKAAGKRARAAQGTSAAMESHL